MNPLAVVALYLTFHPASLQALAVRAELLDPRERAFVLVRVEDYGDDCRLLWSRARDFAGQPFAADAHRLPARDAINELLAFNREYRRHLELRRVLEPHRQEELEDAAAEAEQLYRWWDRARDARCEFFYVPARRGALRDLRDQLGPEAYHLGRWPPCVPLWRFAATR